jgi:hypothetical protein
VKVRKSDCEETVAGTRGNGEFAPIVLKKSVDEWKGLSA